MSGSSSYYLYMAALCGIIFGQILIVTKLFSKQWLILHPDTIMLVITGIVGIIAVKGAHMDFGGVANDSLVQTEKILNTFLFPCLIVAEMISLHRDWFTRKIKVSLIYGVLATILNVVATFFAIKATGFIQIGDFYELDDRTLLCICILFNMSDDTGYKLILTQTKDRQLFKMIRERTVINFLMACGTTYLLSEKMNPEISEFQPYEYFTEGFMVIVISASIGITIGVLSSFVQRSSSSLRESTLSEIMYIFCVSYLSSFIGSIKSFYMSEDIVLIALGLVMSGYSRYNLSAECAERLAFLLLLFTKICRMAILSISGLVVVDSIFDSQAILSAFRIYIVLIGTTLLTHTGLFLTIRTFSRSMRYSMKEYLLMYLCSLIKGPLVFLVASKYLNEQGTGGELIKLVLVSSTLIFNPLVYITAKYYQKKEEDSEEYMEELMSAYIRGKHENKATQRYQIFKFFDFLNEAVFSPLMIYDYHKRKEAGSLSKIRRIFFGAIKHNEMAMSTKSGKGREAAVTFLKNNKGDFANLFAVLVANQGGQPDGSLDDTHYFDAPRDSSGTFSESRLGNDTFISNMSLDLEDNSKEEPLVPPKDKKKD